MRNPFESVNLDSEYKLKNYFVKNKSFIEPQSITVGEREDYKKAKGKNDGPPVQKKIPVQIEFVPLREILKKFFEIPNVFKNTMDYIASIEKNEIIITNFVQGNFWRNLKSTFDPTKIILPLFVYNDDYETNDPLGSRAGFNKNSAVYASIPCLPLIYQSKLENIFLFSLFNSLDRKLVGDRAVFRIPINELEFLEEHGIHININDSEQDIFFRFVLLLGDNLGLNAILGFVQSFSANFYCRICLMNKRETGRTFDEDFCTLRNVENYNEGIEQNDVSKTGIVKPWVFHNSKLSSFHVTKNIIVDAMHDLLERILKYDLAMLLAYYIDVQKYFSLSQLNERLNAFDYDDNNKKSRPPEITLAHLTQKFLHMSASEMFCFFRILPLLIADFVPEGDEHWELVTLLKLIAEIVFSKKIHKNIPSLLKSTIKEYLSLVSKLFGEKYLKPKHHFLVHYPRCLEEMGPLGNISSMRYEAKHSQGKTVAKVSRNRVNIARTIALKESYTLNFRILNTPSLSEIISGPEITDASNDLSLPYDEKLSSTQWIEYLGSKINCRTILVAPIE